MLRRAPTRALAPKPLPKPAYPSIDAVPSGTMALPFHPDPGTLLVCNFDTGFRPPEMVKVRPVVVVSPRRRRGAELCTVVPLSTTRPEPEEPFHHRMDRRSLVGRYARAEATWAKCDMLYTVSLERLDRVKVDKDARGKRRYVAQQIIEADWQAIRRCVALALGLDVPA